MPDSVLPAANRQGPNCHQCRFFAVSWDPRLPYLCRLMGFKSRHLPALEVLRVDGVFCQGFDPKDGVAPDPRPVHAAAGCTLQLSGRLPQAPAGQGPLPEAELPDLRRLSTFRRLA